MSQPPFDFDSQSGIDDYLLQRRRPLQDDDVLEKVFVEPEIRERAIATRNKLRRLFLMLLAFGLGMGLLVGGGVAIVMYRFGLAEKSQSDQDLPTLRDLPQYQDDAAP